MALASLPPTCRVLCSRLAVRPAQGSQGHAGAGQAAGLGPPHTHGHGRCQGVRARLVLGGCLWLPELPAPAMLLSSCFLSIGEKCAHRMHTRARTAHRCCMRRVLPRQSRPADARTACGSVPCTCTALQGMLYLHGHKPPIIHRDLKSPNLLVEKNWRVKVRATDALLAHTALELRACTSTVAHTVRLPARRVFRACIPPAPAPQLPMSTPCLHAAVGLPRLTGSDFQPTCSQFQPATAPPPPLPATAPLRATTAPSCHRSELQYNCILSPYHPCRRSRTSTCRARARAPPSSLLWWPTTRGGSRQR